MNFSEEDPTSNNSESIAAFSSNASGLTGDNDVSDSSQPKEPPVHKEVNRYWQHKWFFFKKRIMMFDIKSFYTKIFIDRYTCKF